jgi:hypothetical protein
MITGVIAKHANAPESVTWLAVIGSIFAGVAVATHRS